MATASSSAAKGPRASAAGARAAREDIIGSRNSEDLEADIARLREDVSKLAEQLSLTGQHSYRAARRAASEGADQLRAKRDEATEALRSNANELERQLTDTVREKPITSLAVAAGVGFLVALLTNR